MNNICWIVLVLLIGCSPKTKTMEVLSEDGMFLERFEQNTQTQKKEGVFELFSAKGELLETATYKEGQLHGIRKLYYENGQTQTIEQYEHGSFKGLFQTFYTNGQLEIEGVYTNGMMNGDWKRYYDTGELMEIVTFVENEENGPFREFFKNGNLKTEGTYLAGDNEHGLLKLYNQDGQLIKKMNCNKGVCKTTWKKEPDKKS